MTADDRVLTACAVAEGIPEDVGVDDRRVGDVVKLLTLIDEKQRFTGIDGALLRSEVSKGTFGYSPTTALVSKVLTTPALRSALLQAPGGRGSGVIGAMKAMERPSGRELFF